MHEMHMNDYAGEQEIPSATAVLPSSLCEECLTAQSCRRTTEIKTPPTARLKSNTCGQAINRSATRKLTRFNACELLEK